MPSAWIDDPKIKDAFQEFLDLYDVYISGKTADPVRLQLRINRIWGDLKMEVKRDWTQRMMKLGKFDENVCRTMREWNGTVTKFMSKSP